MLGKLSTPWVPMKKGVKRKRAVMLPPIRPDPPRVCLYNVFFLGLGTEDRKDEDGRSGLGGSLTTQQPTLQRQSPSLTIRRLSSSIDPCSTRICWHPSTRGPATMLISRSSRRSIIMNYHRLPAYAASYNGIQQLRWQ